MKFAIIENDKIKKVIIADTMEQAQLSSIQLNDLQESEFDLVELEEEDIFEESLLLPGEIIPPKPFDSWNLIEGQWKPPKDVPENIDRVWMWDEDSVDWKDMGPAEYL